jgi:GTP-binding protein EngB required for normal cell division
MVHTTLQAHNDDRITEIIIRAGQLVDSIQLKMFSGNIMKAGGNGGRQKKIVLKNNEHVTQIETRGGDYLDQITIHTTRKVYGPFGGKGGKQLEPQVVPVGSIFSGFIVDATHYVKRVELLSENKNTPCNTVVILGRTGDGKSTLVDMLKNYFENKSFHDKVQIKNKPEYNNGGQRTSKTNACTTYDFANHIGKFQFIDTPGMSDTGGVERDNANVSMILEKLTNIPSLTAIIMVVNGTNARYTNEQQNVFTRIHNILPNVFQKRVLCVFTMCDEHNSAAAENVNFFKPVPICHYFMDNSFFLRNSSTQAEEAWEKSLGVLRLLLEDIQDLGPRGTIAFSEIREKHNELRGNIAQVSLEIDRMQKLETAIKKAILQKSQSQSDEDLYRNFTSTSTVKSVVLQDCARHSTFCSKCIGTVTCHENCGLKETTTVGDAVFLNCWCIDAKKCKVCQCDVSTHFHAKKERVEKVETVQTILAEAQKNYNHAKEKSKQLTSQSDLLQRDLDSIRIEMKNKYADIERLCVEMTSICHGYNLSGEIKCIIEELERQHETERDLNMQQEIRLRINTMNEMNKRLVEQNEQQGGYTSTKRVVSNISSNKRKSEHEIVEPRDSVEQVVGQVVAAGLSLFSSYKKYKGL